MDVDKRKNYRKQPELKCCSTCKNVEFYYEDINCFLAYFASCGKKYFRFVDPTDICDCYERSGK